MKGGMTPEQLLDGLKELNRRSNFLAQYESRRALDRLELTSRHDH